MEFSEKLILLRKREGLCQEQLADRLGVTRQSVSKWEPGTAMTEFVKLISLSELFDVTVDYLVKDGNVARVVTGQTEGAKKAVLRYKVVEGTQVPTNVAILDIHIETGRFHQIRVQMSHAGMPLLGDSKYGTQESATLSRQLGIRNVALCAYAVEFMHPVTGNRLGFNIEPQFLHE